jgi:hypothetical protein
VVDGPSSASVWHVGPGIKSQSWLAVRCVRREEYQLVAQVSVHGAAGPVLCAIKIPSFLSAYPDYYGLIGKEGLYSIPRMAV